MPNDVLTADALRATMQTFRDLLRSHQQVINRLNVYPVPDGDTGTNMSLTVQSVCEAIDAANDGLSGLCDAISQGSLMGARGNSGVILSQILRGLASETKGSGDGLDADGMIAALAAASTAAYGAVMKPVEGTILTVVRGAAEGAASVTDGSSLHEVLFAARAHARDALASTPDLLPVLADAGVVDAGGTGFLLLIDALLHVIADEPLPDAPIIDDLEEAIAYSHQHSGGHGAGDIADLRYEVMYLLDAPDETIPAFKTVWAGIGDSIVVVGGDGLWNCHIHTDDIGAAVEAGIDCGRPRQIRVTDLLEQVEEEKWVRDSGAPEDLTGDNVPVETAIVAVSVGDGIRRLFHSLGVQRFVAGGQTMNPSTSELLAAVEACPSDNVIILPNNGNIIPVAEQVDAQTTKSVRVVPTRRVNEAVAALVSYDPHASLDDNFAALVEGAESVTAGEVTRAVRSSTCEVGPIEAGDWLGIARKGIVAVEDNLTDVTLELIRAILTPDHEILTLLEGEGSTVADTRRITGWLDENHPDLVVEVHNGGQPLYPYYLGIE